ncbi:MAG: hypothetical protein WCN81_04970 [Actinomycetes bacterium]
MDGDLDAGGDALADDVEARLLIAAERALDDVGGGLLQVSAATPATSSTTGALTVVGGLGVGMDAYFNGLRVGKGSGNVASNTVTGAGAAITGT